LSADIFNNLLEKEHFMADTITKRIRLRQGDSTTAKANNEILRQGEAFFETDTGDIKVGDGETRYNNLLGIVSESNIAQKIAQGIYTGCNLSEKFAAEIANYSSTGRQQQSPGQAFRHKTENALLQA